MTTAPRVPLLVIAGICLVLVPVVAWGAASYGVETAVWDVTYGTYTYVEQPGSEVVLVGGGLLALALLVAAVLAFVRATRRAQASASTT